MPIASRISSDIEIEHHDDGPGPDRFVVSADGMSYTVLASEACLTAGDLETVSLSPRPMRATDGTTVQIVNIHDEHAAKARDFPYGRSRMVMLVVLDSPVNGPRVGSYHDFAAFGKGPAIRPTNDATPRFVGMFVDVTEEFLASARPEQIQARLDMGKVYQRLCVDLDPRRPWVDGCPDGIIPCGLEAPSIDGLGRRERAGLLAEAGFTSLEAFRSERIAAYPQTREWAEALASAGDHHPLPSPEGEALHYYRLHGDEKVQDEFYLEMTDVAVMAFKAITCPELAPETQATPNPMAFGV